MKKLLLIVLSLILVLLVGCEGNRVSVTDEYRLMLYENSLSGHDDTNTERVTGRFLDSKDVESKAIGQKRVETFFGKTIEFTYDSASSSKLRKGDRLNAEGKADGRSRS